MLFLYETAENTYLTVNNRDTLFKLIYIGEGEELWYQRNLLLKMNRDYT